LWTRPGQDCQTWPSSIEPYWWNHLVRHSVAAPTIEIRAALNKDKLSVGELAARLGLDKSAASRRLWDATGRGYLVNLETRRGRPARIVLGDPIPEMMKLLPEPDELGA
jgi:hypothetical protein